MESGETFDNQSHAEKNSWKGVSSPQSGTPNQPTGQLPPVYFNTSDNPVSSAPSPSSYAQYQNSPTIPQGGDVASAPPYPDAYQYAPSPGSGRMMQHSQGVYAGSARWPGPNSSATQHNPYLAHDRSRYAHPPYPGFDPTKQYVAQPGYGNQPLAGQSAPWGGTSHPQAHPGYPDTARLPRHVQADIAGPVVPAGLQALQANNNNATLMQHQHTPMLVPNPHYNQNKAQSQTAVSHMAAPKNPIPQPTDDQRQNQPLMTQSAAKNPMAPNTVPPPEYYPAYPPHAQQSTMGPMHHNTSAASPSMAPYPANPATPGSTKSKGRGNKCYQCPKCVKVFRRGDHLKRHLLSVHDHEHPYQCGECGKGFASVPTLTKHAKSLHIGTLTKGLMCLRCQLTFKSIVDLEVHATSLHVQEDELYMQNINTSSKQHLCNACSKSFSSAANLKRHMQLLHRTKDETKLFCRECGKGFSRSDNLQKHMEKVHGGQFNGMPDVDEHEETESVTQSETDSRGPSADTDESSMSAPPSKQWSYPTQPGPGTMSPSVSSEGGQPLHPHISGYPAQYAKAGTVPLPPISQSALPQAQPPQLSAPSTILPASISLGQPPMVQAPSLQARQDTIKSNEVMPPQDLVPAKVTAQRQLPKPVETRHEMLPVRQDQPPVLPQQIEPKTVSEALSMAMKALSDFDYDIPGCDTYPVYASNTPVGEDLQPNPGYVYQSYPYLSRMENGRNGTPNNTRPPGMGTGLPAYNHPNYSQHGGNFLMNMPPPPGVTTAGLLPSAQVAGGQRVPQLSRLLQGGGGGVNSPTMMNDNNNSNLIAQFQINDTMQHGNTKSKAGPKKRKIKNEVNTIGMEFVENVAMMEPQKMGEGEATTLECNVCKISYESIDGLMQHIEMIHLKKNPHECCICNKKFAQAGNVKRHIRFVHLRERPFRCKDCSSTFDRLCYLQRHMRSHLHPDDGSQDFDHLKPCSCPECGKKCLTAHHLRGHMQRKHFAKNKQNYDKFLMKYRHLEAIGAGPGAITSPNRGRKGGRRKKNAKSNQNGQLLPNKSENELPYSSKMLFSSIHPNALSANELPVGTPPAPMVQIPYALPQQGYANSQMQQKMSQSQPNFHHGATFFAADGLQQSFSPFVNGVGTQHVSNPVSATEGTLRLLPAACPTQENSVNGFIRGVIHANEMVKRGVRRVKYMTGGRRKKRAPQKLLPFRCQSCVHVSFSSLALLKSHVSVVHRASLKRHVCLSCGASFATNRSLRSHVFETHRTETSTRKHRKPARLNPITPVSAAPSPPEIHNVQYQSFGNNIPISYSALNDVRMVSYMPAPTQYPQYQYNPSSAVVSAGNAGHHFPTHLPLVQT